MSLVAGLLLTSILAVAIVPALRPWLLVALASVLLVSVGMVLAALLRRDAPHAVAAWLGRRSPDLGGALADAVEFAGDLAGRGIRTGSAELAGAHVDRAADMARQDDPLRHAAALAPPPWRLAAIVAGAALVALTLVPSGRLILLHGPPPPAPPRVTYGAVELTFRHPAYLRLPDRKDVGAGDIEAPVGTHVDVSVHADRPLASGRLESSEGAAVEMRVSGGAATGTLVVTRDGTYRIALRGTGGEIDPEPPTHVVRALPDAAPVVRLRAPRRDVVLSEGDVLVVEWLAQDDHGISEAALVVERTPASDEEPAEPGASGEGILRLPLGTFDPPEVDRSGAATLSTRELGLHAGDEAWLRVEARDDDAVTGPKWAASSRILVVVRSEQERESELESQQEELAERLLALLALHLVASADRLSDAGAVGEHHRAFSPQLTAVASLAGRASEAARDEMDDYAAASALQDMRARLDALARARARRHDGLSSGDASLALTAHAELHEREIPELERDVLFFDMWADRRASLRASDAAEDLLAKAQDLLHEAEQSEPEATAEALLAEAAELEAATEALGGLLAQLAQAGGADPAAAAEARELLQALARTAEELSQRLQAGDRSSARRDARRAQTMASELAGRVADLADAGAVGDPELAREIDRAEADLRRLRREQADLRDETNRMRDEMRAALSPEDLALAEEGFAELDRLATEAVEAHSRGDAILGRADQVDELFRAIEERDRMVGRRRELLEGGLSAGSEVLLELQRIQAAIERAHATETLGFDRVESLMRTSMNARELLGRMRQVIADRDLGAARVPARWALDQLRALIEDVGDEGQIGEARPDLSTAAARTAEVIDRLEELENQIERSAQQAMTSGQRQRLGEAGGRQGSLQQQARALASRLRELSADAPFLGEGVAGQVDEAGGHMDDATRGLLSRRPGEASEEQGEALSRLEDAADALSPTGDRGDGSRPGGRSQQARAGQGGRPGGREGGDGRREGRRGRSSRDRVEIPDADDFKVPREFREEILEAMRESHAPDGYAEQVREYYRRLVE